MHICLDVGLGREGSGLGLLLFLCCVWVQLGLGFVWKMPCDLRRPFLLYMLSLLHSIIGALVVWLVKYLGWAFVAAAAFQHLFLVLCYIKFYLYK